MKEQIRIITITVIIIMISLSVISQEVQDTLSLDKALQIGMKNTYFGDQDQDALLLAVKEINTINKITTQYYYMLYCQESLTITQEVKNKLNKELAKKYQEQINNSEVNLDTNDFIIELEADIINKQYKLNKSKNNLSYILGTNKDPDYLSTPFRSYFSNISSDIEKKSNIGLSVDDLKRKIEDFNYEVLQMQNLTIKKQIATYIYDTQLKKCTYNYSELKKVVNNYISHRMSYLTKLFELSLKYTQLVSLISL